MNQPGVACQPWRLPRVLLDRVKAAAHESGETALAFVTRALTRELDRPRIDPHVNDV